MRLRYLLPAIVLLLIGAGYALTRGPQISRVEYGLTFSVQYAEEIGLNWKVVYRNILEDLQVRRLRIPVYWSRVESKKGVYSWDEIDYQVQEAQAHDATVILALGRRVPRWPECHVPEWAKKESWPEQKDDLRTYMQAVIERYRKEKSIIMWQVENEPYLSVFATDECGALDETFFNEEIALVHSLDSRPILTTDSGNLGTWAGAYRHGDTFGTSVYLYFWNESLGSFRTVLPPAYYRAKANIMRLLFGDKPIMLSELSLEPWFGDSFDAVPLSEQLARMNIKRFNEIASYARDTDLNPQYLWGVEWWYFMKTKGEHAEFWNAARELYK